VVRCTRLHSASFLLRYHRRGQPIKFLVIKLLDRVGQVSGQDISRRRNCKGAGCVTLARTICLADSDVIENRSGFLDCARLLPISTTTLSVDDYHLTFFRVVDANLQNGTRRFYCLSRLLCLFNRWVRTLGLPIHLKPIAVQQRLLLSHWEKDLVLLLRRRHFGHMRCVPDCAAGSYIHRHSFPDPFPRA
jgi:hypothetical protein